MRYYSLIILLFVACNQSQEGNQLLSLSEDKTQYRFWAIENNYCGTPHWFDYVNDSTTMHICYHPIVKDNEIVPNQFELFFKFWYIDGVIYPTKEELIRILKEYRVRLNDFEIAQIDSLSYKIRNIHTNDKFDLSFSLDRLEYYQMSSEEKDDYFIDSKNVIWNCKSVENDGKYILQISYFNVDG